MKKCVKLLIIVVIISTFTLSASAAEEDYIDRFESILPDGENINDTSDIVSSVSVDGLLRELTYALSGRRGEIFSFFLLLLGCSVLMALSSTAPDGVRPAVECGVGLVASGLLLGRILPVIGQTLDSISALTDFFSRAAPILAAVSLAGGGGGASAVESAGIGLAVSFVSEVMCTALVGVIGFALALALLSAFGDTGVGGLISALKGIFTWLIGISTAVITGTLALQSVVASATDSAAMRSAKYAATGMIPIVGGTVSGALSTLASGLSYAKGVIGAGTVAVLVTTALAPLAVLLLYRLAFTVALRLCEGFSTTAVIKSFASVLDMLIAVFSLSMLIFVFEIILMIKSGVALLG